MVDTKIAASAILLLAPYATGHGPRLRVEVLAITAGVESVIVPDACIATLDVEPGPAGTRCTPVVLTLIITGAIIIVAAGPKLDPTLSFRDRGAATETGAFHTIVDVTTRGA